MPITMKEQHKIPVSKMQRASRFLGTGAKIGGNVIKYYAKKMVDPSTERSELDEANAEDIYNSLSQLKGSALKVAQMMSMDENVLPRAYTQKFQMAQYNAPPLSYPLVVKTFRRFFGKNPDELFDSFSRNAVNAASIGQVHKATIDGKEFAVKVQYPGVADSVSSDLKMAKPIAMRIMNIKAKDLDKYMQEVETRLLEETDYELELKRSVELSEKCSHFSNLVFPKYYADFSSKRVITMDWIDGIHLSEWIETNPSQEERNEMGQRLWDFYNFQMHELKIVHADPHPGNFIVTENGDLGIIDFGCVKEIPEEFYYPYFQSMEPGLVEDQKRFEALLEELEFFLPSDTDEEKRYLLSIFTKMVRLIGRPFSEEVFDFGDKEFFGSIFNLGEEISKDKKFRKTNAARGSQHGIYINRTYFGLYNLLHQIQAVITPRGDEIRKNFMPFQVV
ncbi:AarF/ABC1/UbiB kinase family protein [bacterium SCSIO 12741]|nr:AarF/ABC1/UbiB kinase family protein [bacterium SCSIO 12741]